MSVNAAGLEVSGNKNPNWKGGKVQKECLVCQKVFFVKPGYTHAKFCSLQCAGVAQRGKNRPANIVIRYHNTGPRKPHVEKACKWCGASFSVVPSRAEMRFFCCKACQFAWRSQRHRGEANPNWHGGVSQLPYPFNWPEVSAVIKARDGHKCLNPYCQHEVSIINVHHIDYNKNNLDGFNLITLCSQCNARANYNRPWWIHHYYTIQYTRGFAPATDPLLFPAVLERAGRKGVKHPLAVLSENDVLTIRKERAAGVSGHALAQRFKVSDATISLIHHRKVWDHI